MFSSFSRFWLKVWGWEVIGVNSLPQPHRCVIIGAPHTSNWDLPISLLVAAVLRIRIHWMGKHTLFRFPFGFLMKLLGGIPVNRAQRNNVVETTIQEFNNRDSFIAVIPPEATRSNAKRWKTGFYYIALGAKVPIVCGFLDYKKKQGGLGLIFHPTGDILKDFEIIKEFYASIKGKYPEKASKVVF